MILNFIEQQRSNSSGSLETIVSDDDPVVPAIEFRNVRFSYDNQKVLDDVSFNVRKGEIKIILSGSGGGKSTILKLILGLLKSDAGQIFINCEEITDLEESEMQRVRDTIGMVFQESALFDSLSVYDNVAYRLHERGVPEEEVEKEVRFLLGFVGLEDEINKLPNELSGGMQKRASIARALVGAPKILLFDEPTAALDPPTAYKICELIIRLRDLEDVSSIVVTHQMDVVKYLTTEYAIVNEEGKVFLKEEGAKLCLINTNVMMLRDGQIIFTGTNEEFLRSADPYIQSFIQGTEIDTNSVPKEVKAPG